MQGMAAFSSTYPCIEKRMQSQRILLFCFWQPVAESIRILIRTIRLRVWGLLPDWSEVHVTVKSTDGQPVEESVKLPVLVKASLADFQPGEMSLAQPSSGKCAVRGCFGVHHANGLAGS